MDGMEEKLGSILANPDMMQKIMSLAQSLNSQEAAPAQEALPPKQEAAPFPEIDLGTLQKLSGFAKKSGIDRNQQTLLTALAPYLSNQRISKLEKAMRAAKMAQMASSFLGSNALNSILGR